MLIDITRLLDRSLQGCLPTGVDRVSLEYVRYFRHRARGLVRFAGRWITLGATDSLRVFDTLLDDAGQLGRVVRCCVGKSYVLRWHDNAKPCILLNTGHNGLDSPNYSSQIRLRGLRPIFFLHDLIPSSHPEYCRVGESEKHQRRLTTMLGVGQGLVVNSLVTRHALEVYAARHGWSVPTCVVAPLAPTRLSPYIASRPLAEPYFVVLGTIEPRKNHLLLLHLWRQLVDELGNSAPRLVIIGQRGWECEQIVDLLERCEAIRGFVIEKNRCSDADLATWLYHAQALLFPSFVEGYGIPLVEALSLGVPVVASDLPVFREIAGNIPEYLSPLDGAGWRHSILNYAQTSSVARQAQRLRMQGYQAPTWSGHFEVVDELIERCLYAPGNTT